MEFRFLSLMIVLQIAPLAHAGAAREIAQSAGSPEARAPQISSLSDEVKRLFGQGIVPRVTHLDDKYSGRFGSKQCRKAVQQLRDANVRTRSIMASDALVARAVSAGVSRRHIEKALATFLANQEEIPNQKYITVIDFNKRSNEKRMFIIDVTTGQVSSYHTSAGRGSDRRGSGVATHFSNKANTNASSLGCALAAGKYDGKHGKSLMLHGFEDSNDNSCERNIVIHRAPYVGGIPGRSEGCPAVKSSVREEVFAKLEGGGLICSYKDGEVLEAERSLASKKKKKKYKPAKKSYRGRYSRGRRR